MDNLNINQQNKSRNFVIISIIMIISCIWFYNSNPDEADIVRAARAKVKSSLEIKLENANELAKAREQSLKKLSEIDDGSNAETQSKKLAKPNTLEDEVVHVDSWVFIEAMTAMKAIDGSSTGSFGELLKNVGASYFQDYILESINNKANRKCKNYLFFTNCDFYHDDRLFMSCNGKLGDVICEYNPPYTESD